MNVNVCVCVFSLIHFARLSGQFHSFDHVTIAVIFETRAHLQYALILSECQTSIVVDGGIRI